MFCNIGCKHLLIGGFKGYCCKQGDKTIIELDSKYGVPLRCSSCNNSPEDLLTKRED